MLIECTVFNNNKIERLITCCAVTESKAGTLSTEISTKHWKQHALKHVVPIKLAAN